MKKNMEHDVAACYGFPLQGPCQDQPGQHVPQPFPWARKVALLWCLVLAGSGLRGVSS